jgi:hypothetical protein
MYRIIVRNFVSRATNIIQSPYKEMQAQLYKNRQRAVYLQKNIEFYQRNPQYSSIMILKKLNKDHVETKTVIDSLEKRLEKSSTTKNNKIPSDI